MKKQKFPGWCHFKQWQKITVEGYGDRVLIATHLGGTFSKWGFTIEDFFDKDNPKKKGHLSFFLHHTEIDKVKIID